MIGYAATEVFDQRDVEAFMLALRAVAVMPDNGRSCHEVCADVADMIGYEPVRGYYGDVEHSWFELPSGAILDVYAPGRFPQVQLVHARGTLLPEASSYRKVR